MRFTFCNEYKIILIIGLKKGFHESVLTEIEFRVTQVNFVTFRKSRLIYKQHFENERSACVSSDDSWNVNLTVETCY